MVLKLVRERSSTNVTFGTLYIDDLIFGFTLESSHDMIPCSTYDVNKHWYANIQKFLPEIVYDSNICIMEGQYAWQLKGSIAIGHMIHRPMLLKSDHAFELLMSMLDFNELKLIITEIQ